MNASDDIEEKGDDNNEYESESFNLIDSNVDEVDGLKPNIQEINELPDVSASVTKTNSIAPEITTKSAPEEVSEKFGHLEKAYPFIKAINRKGDVRCNVCGTNFNTSKQGLAALVRRHVASIKHTFYKAVEDKYPFLKDYPFIVKASFDDVVRCKWCKMEINIAHDGVLEIERHTASKEHRILAAQLDPNYDSSGLGMCHTNDSTCCEF